MAGPRILLVSDTPAGAGLSGLASGLRDSVPAELLRSVPSCSDRNSGEPPTPQGGGCGAVDAVDWADAVVVDGAAAATAAAVDAALDSLRLGKALVVCDLPAGGADLRLPAWILERAEVVLVADLQTAARARASAPRSRPVVIPRQELPDLLARIWRAGDAGRGAGRTTAPSPVPGAPGQTPTETALQQRVRDLERSLESALNDLSRLHASRLWRLGEFYWRLRPWLLLAWRRLLHPVEAARLAAPRLIPIRMRTRIVRAIRTGARADAAPAPHDLELGRLREKLASTGAPRPVVLVLPIIEWGFRYQRPQQLAAALGARGHTVLFASCAFAVGGREISVAADPLAEGVWGVRLPSVRRLDVYRDTIDARSLERMVHAIRDFRLQTGLLDAVVLCELPFWRPLAQRLREAFAWPLVYDRMDEHRGFSTNAPAMLREEGRLLAGADLVTATSSRLEESSLRANLHTVRVPNGCDWPRWSTPMGAGLPAGLQRPIIGYFGAISEWFDGALVERLAAARPQWSFVLVGSTYGAELGRLARLPNVHLLGERPYPTLAGLAKEFDAGIIPFRRSALTDATDPVKFYEMMALGLDVVATALPELEGRGDLVRLASTPDEFLAALDEVVRRPPPPELVERRRQFAFANRWETRAAMLASSFQRLHPLASVLIVTYNNLSLTRMCLDSIWKNTAYPNFEIVIVDNGSSDGTREMLREEARAHDNVTTVENEANRGFAAACNQAIARARGQVLCFLNNDTVVTRGWLSTMVASLRRNPRAGLVGPVSNAVGNEARVQPGYASVDEMPEWASSWTREHAGEALELPMLALFCAAMRREVRDEVGDLDERFEVGMFEDDDYCRRIRRAGYKLYCLRDVFVHHWQRASFRLLGEEAFQQIYEKNKAIYRAKWEGARDGR